jgi:hypothetical protein
MPMSHRKGIREKAGMREDVRRREAKENGIILEKKQSGRLGGAGQMSSSSGKKRARGVDAPSLGKFRGGTLQLSKKDIAGLQGPSTRGRQRPVRRR